MMDIENIKNILPHRFPFLLVDRVQETVANSHILAYKNITINEQVFEGHFPQKAIYPGVMIIEGLAQAGGVLAFVSMFGAEAENKQDKLVYFMSIDRAKFRSPVLPGDKLEYRLDVLKHKGAIWVLEGKAYVDGKLVAQAELKAMIADKED